MNKLCRQLATENWILDSGATCHMTPDISDFIPNSLEKIDDKCIEVADGHFVTAKQTIQAQIKIRDNDGKPSLLRYITFYWHQTCAIKYFPLLL